MNQPTPGPLRVAYDVISGANLWRGGHLVAEIVETGDVPLFAKAPEMWRALANLVATADSATTHALCISEARALLAEIERETS